MPKFEKFYAIYAAAEGSIFSAITLTEARVLSEFIRWRNKYAIGSEIKGLFLHEQTLEELFKAGNNASSKLYSLKFTSGESLELTPVPENEKVSAELNENAKYSLHDQAIENYIEAKIVPKMVHKNKSRKECNIFGKHVVILLPNFKGEKEFDVKGGENNDNNNYC